MTGRVVIIPCGGAKLDRPAPAGEMYVGSYHRAARRAADALVADGGRILILSAFYGLLELTDGITPYDLTMGDPGSVNVETLREQARIRGVADATDVIALGGRRYVDAVAQVWPNARRPLDGTTGMGDQLRRMTLIARREYAVDAAPVARRGPGRPRKVDGPKPSQSVRVADATWEAAQAKAERLNFPFADVVAELLTHWTQGEFVVTADRFPHTLDDVADELRAPRADIVALADGLTDDPALFDQATRRLSRHGRKIITESWMPDHITVEIAGRGAGDVWQALDAAESHDTAEGGWAGLTMATVAQDIADRLATDPQSPTDGRIVRVRLWAGVDADTGAPHAAEAFAAAPRLPEDLPGCGAPSTVRIEGYSPKDGRMHGALDVVVHACGPHARRLVDALREVGYATWQDPRPTTSPNTCGAAIDYTKSRTAVTR